MTGGRVRDRPPPEVARGRGTLTAMRRSGIALVALAVSAAGCRGYWATENSYTSRQRSGAPSMHTAFDFLGFQPGRRRVLVRMQAYCDTSWSEVVTTTTTERFRSTTSWKLWLGLGSLTMLAGVIPLAAGGPQGLGYAMVGAGALEVGYALPALFASSRRRTRVSTENASGSAGVDCGPEVFAPGQFTLTAPWNETSNAVEVDASGNMLFAPIGSCAGTEACLARYRGSYLLTHRGSGRTWRFELDDAAVRTFLAR